MKAFRRQLPREVLLYGAALAVGTAVLQWLDWQFVARTAPATVTLALVALAFLALGLWAGWRLTQPLPVLPDTDIAAGLGISPRELEVLGAIARGLSTKEIARLLDLSPNTVKTHTQRLFEKLPASNRTQATARARALGLLP